MNPGMIFRKIGGHIVPIARKAGTIAKQGFQRAAEKHPVATGFAILGGSAYAGYKTRQQFSKRVLRRKTGGTGSELTNFIADAGLSYGYLQGAQKLGGHHAAVAIRRAVSVLKGGR